MENINKKRRLTVIVFLAVQLFVAGQLQAQSEQFLWEVHSPDIKIMQKQMDSMGNVYIAGTFESQGMLAGRWICPADSSEDWLFASQGVFIAKFDTTGAMQWCRAAKDWKDGLGYPCGFSLRDNKIYFAFVCEYPNLLLPWDVYQANKHCWLYFFDTIYYGMINGVVQPYGTLPYRCGDPNTYLVTFDLDGNRIDTKTAKVFGGRDKYLQDSRGYHYFVVSKPTYRSNPRDYIMLNDDTTAKFYYPVNNRDFYPHERDYRRTPYLVRINPEWTNVKFFQLTDSLDGFRNSTGDSVFCGYDNYFFISTIVDESNIFYATVQTCGAQGNIHFSLPLKLYFNDGSFITEDECSNEIGSTIEFIMSFDTVGRVKWVQQFYYEKLDPIPGMEKNRTYCNFLGGVFVDSSNLYYAGCFQCPARTWRVESLDSIPNVYFDREHRDTLFFPNKHQSYIATVVTYNKHTGTYLNHLSFGSNGIATQTGDGAEPYVTKDYIIVNVSDYGYSHDNPVQNYTIKYNRHTGEIEKYDTIASSTVPENRGVLASENGYIEKWIYNGGTDIMSPYFHIPLNNASILFYYDSLLDKRRSRVPQTEIPAVEESPVGLKVYPNPASGIITVSATTSFSQIELYDSEGRLLEQRQVDPRLGLIRPIKLAQYSTTIDLRNLPRGLYYVRVQSDKGVTICKIIKI